MSWLFINLYSTDLLFTDDLLTCCDPPLFAVCSNSMTCIKELLFTNRIFLIGRSSFLDGIGYCVLSAMWVIQKKLSAGVTTFSLCYALLCRRLMTGSYAFQEYFHCVSIYYTSSIRLVHFFVITAGMFGCLSKACAVTHHGTQF